MYCSRLLNMARLTMAGAVIVTLIAMPIRASENGPARLVVLSDEQRIALTIKTISDAIANPNPFNLMRLDHVVPADDTAAVYDKIRNFGSATSSLRTTSSSTPALELNLSPGATVPTANGYEVDVSSSITPELALPETDITLTFERFAHFFIVRDLGPVLDTLAALSADARPPQLAGNRQARQNSNRAAASISGDYMFYPHTLLEIQGTEISRFNVPTSKQHFDDDVILSRPYGVRGFAFRDPLLHPTNTAYLTVVSDANWDRLIVARNIEDYDAIVSYGSHGTGATGFACPQAIANVGHLFAVLDRYNNRVTFHYVQWTRDRPFDPYSGINCCFEQVVDVAGAQQLETDSSLHCEFAILDGGAGEVTLVYISGTPIKTLFEGEPNMPVLLDATALCYGTDYLTGYQDDRLYIVDNGAKKVYCRRTSSSLLYTSTPDGLFPDDAQLTGISCGPFGYPYVVDSYNHQVYMLDPVISTGSVAIYGREGTDDGELLYPSMLTFGYGSKWVGAPLYEEPMLYYNALCTEYFGNESGVRSLLPGNGAAWEDWYYTPKCGDSVAASTDWIDFRWQQTGVTKTTVHVFISDTSWVLVDEVVNPINLPGEHHHRLYLDSFSDQEYFKIEVTLDPMSGTPDTVIGTEFMLDRWVDTSCHRDRYVIDTVGIEFLGEEIPDTCDYYSTGPWWMAWVKARDTWDESQPLWYKWRQILTDSNVVTFSLDTSIYFPEQFSVHTLSDTAFFKFVAPPKFDTLWGGAGILRVGLADDFGNDLECGSSSQSYMAQRVTGTARSPADVCIIEEPVTLDTFYYDSCDAPCFDCTPPPPPPPPGCPVVSVWNGTEYVRLNNILPQSEGLAAGGQDQVDGLPIYSLPPNQSGLIRLLVSESENEVSQFDQLELLVAELAEEQEDVLFTNQNALVELTGEELAPASATTDDGRDITSVCAKTDGKRYGRYDPGHIDFVYDFSRLPGRQLMESSGGGWEPGDPPKDPAKIAAIPSETRVENRVTIYAAGESGEWLEVERLYARKSEMAKIVDLSDYIIGHKLRVRLEWTWGVSFDAMPFLFFNDLSTQLQKLQLVSASHSSSGEVRSRLDQVADEKVSLSPDEYIDLGFEYPVTRQDKRYVLLLRAAGRYEQLIKTASSDGPLPTEFEFSQNYPNPFNPSTTFSFSLPRAAPVRLDIFNILGQRVVTLVDRDFEAGRHTVTWDGLDDRGMQLSSGVYLARITAGDDTATRKMVVVK